MMFDGRSAVEVHPKVSVDDLKAFTSISLYMRPPAKQPEQAGNWIADQFVLYLGSKNVSILGDLKEIVLPSALNKAVEKANKFPL